MQNRSKWIESKRVFRFALMLVAVPGLVVAPLNLGHTDTQTPKIVLVPPPPQPPLIPVDTLQENLVKKHHSKGASSIGRAYQGLQKKKYAEAITICTHLLSDSNYADYAYWISAAAHRGLADQQNTAKKYEGALRSSQKAIALNLQIESNFPYSPLLRNVSKDLGLAELLSGVAYWGKKNWTQSEVSFEKAFQRLQTQNVLHNIHASDLEKYAAACKAKEGPLCMSWLQKFLTVFVKKSAELQVISKYYPALSPKVNPLKNSKQSATYKVPDLDQTAFESSMKLFFEESYGQAAKSFQQLLVDYPRSAFRFRAKYWLGQSFTRNQDSEKAQKVYLELHQETPLTYYGLLAAHATGVPLDTHIRAILPMASEIDPALPPLEAIRLKKAESFLAAGAFDLASIELTQIKSRDTLSSPFLLYLTLLNQNARNYRNAFSILGELIQRGYEGAISSFGIRVIFPSEFLALIHKSSEELSLDPLLVLSLIKQESAFDEEANSNAGAMGLMQVMPATALDTDPLIRTDDLLEPEKNIILGTKYLKKVLTRFNGNIVYALAAYNAGPSAVDRWIRESGGKRGMLEFIESIPYKETREYVGAIIRNYFWYSRKIKGGADKDLTYFWNVYGPPETPSKLTPLGSKVPSSTAPILSPPSSLPGSGTPSTVPLEEEPTSEKVQSI